MPFTAMKVGAVQGSASVGRGHFARSLLVNGGVSGATCNASPRDNGRLLLAARGYGGTTIGGIMGGTMTCW
jgi:hypothetical protein